MDYFFLTKLGEIDNMNLFLINNLNVLYCKPKDIFYIITKNNFEKSILIDNFIYSKGELYYIKNINPLFIFLQLFKNIFGDKDDNNNINLSQSFQLNDLIGDHRLFNLLKGSKLFESTLKKFTNCDVFEISGDKQTYYKLNISSIKEQMLSKIEVIKNKLIARESEIFNTKIFLKDNTHINALIYEIIQVYLPDYILKHIFTPEEYNSYTAYNKTKNSTIKIVTEKVNNFDYKSYYKNKNTTNNANKSKITLFNFIKK